ncbi:hypothetical protein [Actinomadura parmotrematis]|uniref:Uncharacterized protein n=1 Tax=Actinomadura parmotrematis TaxID=2864039 RepID=A0ABS7FUC7_9ACTN|nr:hypothetical protein [Actinomadura parmotrematis]MBW8483192.1 hypothetical protein [Actinomadura parmotrematis]
MFDIDEAFEDLRRDVAGGVVAPDGREIVRRARRRARARVAAVTVAAVVAAGSGTLLVHGTAGARPPVTATPSAPPTASARPQGEMVRSDLLYAAAAARDPERWSSDDGGLNVPACSGGTEEEPDPWADDIDGVVRRFDLAYNGNAEPGNEATTTERGEQVLIFDGAGSARLTMARIVRLAATCRGIKVAHPAFGDEAVRLDYAADGQVQRAVAVRQGGAIAVYWDLHNAAPASSGLARHERDARAMAARLAARGFHD